MAGRAPDVLPVHRPVGGRADSHLAAAAEPPCPVTCVLASARSLWRCPTPTSCPPRGTIPLGCAGPAATGGTAPSMAEQPALPSSRHCATGVEEPSSGWLATADADLPSLSYAHLGDDSTSPALRGKRDSPAHSVCNLLASTRAAKRSTSARGRAREAADESPLRYQEQGHGCVAGVH
jgi:hypothetical protein